MAAQRTLINISKGGLLIGFGGYFLDQSLFDVNGGERGIMFDRFRGVLPHVYGEGTHLKMPFVQYPKVFDVKCHPRQISTNTGTKDMQMVNISLRVLSRPVHEKLPTIYTELGEDYEFRVLPSIGNEVLKSVVAKFNADELLTRRQEVSDRISQELKLRATEFNIRLDDVSITHLTFGKEFTAAIEAKQVAEQDSERAKFVVLRAEQEKKAAIIDAEGQAEAAKMISTAMTNFGTAMLEVRRIDAAREIAQTLAGSRNVCYLPSGNKMLLNLPG